MTKPRRCFNPCLIYFDQNEGEPRPAVIFFAVKDVRGKNTKRDEKQVQVLHSAHQKQYIVTEKAPIGADKFPYSFSATSMNYEKRFHGNLLRKHVAGTHTPGTEVTVFKHVGRYFLKESN